MTRISFLSFAAAALGPTYLALSPLACGSGGSGSAGTSDAGSADATTITDASNVSDASGASVTSLDGATSDAGPTDAATTPRPDAAATCTLFDAGPLDEASVAAGLSFVENTGHCNHCHQANTAADAAIVLSGNDNSVVDGGAAYPPNLTPDPATGLGCWTNEQIANAILFGIDPTDGGTFCVMPKFGVAKTSADGGVTPAALTDASVGNVVSFLRSLPPVEHSVPDTVCPSGTAPDAGAAAAAGD